VGELSDAVRGANELRASDVGQQLKGWDAATWRTASQDRGMRSSIVAVSLLDSTPDWDRLHARFARLTRMVPILRERPLFGALGVSMPRMAVDPDFDLDIHLRRMRLPAGGDWADVLTEARRMSLTDFDHARPLWEAVLIEGLAGGRSVLIMKLHHAMADGQATVVISANLFELTAEGTPGEPEAPPAPVASPVSVATVSRANIQDNVNRVLEAARSGAKLFADLALGTVRSPVDTWSEAVHMAESIGRFASIPDSSLSPLMSGRSTTYRFATFDLPFKDMRASAKERGNTVNDIFMGSVTTGLAKYHERHGKPAAYLRFNLPISLRKAVKDGSAANAVTIARFELPVNGVSVDERIKAAHDEVARWRDEPALSLANPLADVSWIVPVPMLASAARTSDITTSNVPGPPIQIYICGSRVVGTWPLVPTVGAAANITLVTYDGTAFVGLSADEVAIPDIDAFADDLRDGFAEVLGHPVGPSDPTATGHRQPSHAHEVRGAAPAGEPAAKRRSPRKAVSKAPTATARAKQPPAKQPPAKRPTTAKRAPAKGAPATRAAARKSAAKPAGG
jgi:diacylglycerol O-acyltransferase / wax synthase